MAVKYLRPIDTHRIFYRMQNFSEDSDEQRKKCQPHTKLYNQICCLLSCSRFRRVCLSLVCIHSLVLLLTLDRGQANDAKQKKLTRLQSFALIKEFQDKRMKYIIFKHSMEIEVKIIRMYKIL